MVEFKVAERYGGMEGKAQEALRQIEDRKYARELNDDGYETVIRYGMAFLGKDCVVRTGERGAE